MVISKKHCYITHVYNQRDPRNVGKTVELFYTNKEQETPEWHDEDEETEQTTDD